jgi:CARDB
MRLFYAVAALSLVGAIVLGGQDGMAQKKKEQAPAPAPVATGPGPDLVIIDSESVIEAGGCNLDEPLIKGTIALKNRGDARADRLLAKPISAVYIPETLDVKDEDIVPNALQPNELFSTDILAGRGAVKEGRGFNGPRKVLLVVDPYNEIKESNETNNVITRTINFKCK